MKREIMKRLQAAGQRAVEHPAREIQRLVAKLTTDELKEIVYEDITDDRLCKIAERAKKS